MVEQSYDVLIVGGGHSGAQAAIALRQNGHEGTIAIATDEPEIPYERPPLSKEYFAGDKTAERIRIRPVEFWEERKIDLLLDTRITEIFPFSHTAVTADGQRIVYGKLIWAAGGSPRRLPIPGAETSQVLYIRTLADADRLKEQTCAARRIVVIGGGYIGLEAAAVLAKAGKTVTLIEALDRVLARAAGLELARHLEQVHRDHGVEIMLAASISHLENDGEATQVHLTDGSAVECDLVIAGIGIVPEVGPLESAGARCSNGVEVDEFCRTSLPGVFAIGDCAAHRNSYAECAMIRLESVQNAVDMAKVAADCISGKCHGYQAVPWFWSNQYDVRIQTVGLSMGHDETVVRGDMGSGSFSIVYLRGGRVIALDCINAAKDFVQGKALVLAGARVSRARLTDVSIPLKSLLDAVDA
jgi:3-phenylpropionate/trans-cinnamate dioxygenase ferredoxin reductase subunit